MIATIHRGRPLKQLRSVFGQVQHGDAVREIGTFTAKTKGDNSQDIAGKFTVLWVREGGSWKINTDIWNMSK